jgi:hypothetical protein
VPTGNGVYRHFAHEIELLQRNPADPVRFHRLDRDDCDSEIRFEQCQRVASRERSSAVAVPISMSFDLLIIFVLLFECSSDDP